jgi:hypothetical protein
LIFLMFASDRSASSGKDTILFTNVNYGTSDALKFCLLALNLKIAPDI